MYVSMYQQKVHVLCPQIVYSTKLSIDLEEQHALSGLEPINGDWSSTPRKHNGLGSSRRWRSTGKSYRLTRRMNMDRAQ
jgi:hypothetical protein